MNRNTYMRIHPLWIGFEIYKLARNILGLYIFMIFIFKKIVNIEYDIIINFIIFISVYSVISTLLYWLNFKFKIDSSALEVINGKIIKTKRHIPLESIVGYYEQAKLWERIFNLSSLEIKIQTTNSDKKIIIPIISNTNSELIKKYIDRLECSSNEILDDYNSAYYTMKKKLLIKGGISSVSVIVFILFLYSLYEKVDDYISIDTKSVFHIFLNNYNYIFPIITILMIASIIYSIVKVFLKYLNFKLNFNSEHIYISWGAININTNIISKKHISALIIKSSFLQQILKIDQISVVNVEANKESNSVNIIIPYIERKDSAQKLSDIMSKNINLKNMHKVPFLGIISKIGRTSIVWFGLLVLMYTYNEIWYIFIILISIIISNQVLKSLFSKIKYDKKRILKKEHGLKKEIFIADFSSISEIHIKESLIQKFLGISTLEIFCKATPLYRKKIYDISKKDAKNIVKIFKNN